MAGGLGGWVQALLSVTAGQALYIFVGGQGVGANIGPGVSSFNGGGAGPSSWGAGGGGGSDIRTISGDLSTRLIVAGGGAGAFGYSGVAGTGGTVNSRLHFIICMRESYLTYSNHKWLLLDLTVVRWHGRRVFHSGQFTDN